MAEQFSIGDGSSYNGSTFVQRSVELGEPVIYVNFNYRVNAFGWLGGKEALAGGAANVGLYDREYHFDDQRSSTNSDPQCPPTGPGICQKGSSWPGSGLTFPSSAVIRTGLLCELFYADLPPSIVH
jgi:hypothetical protein